MGTLSELLRRLFLEVYRLPGPELLLIGAVAILVWAALFRACGLDGRWRIGSGVLLLLWAAAVLWATVLSRGQGPVQTFRLIPLSSYWEVLTGGNPEILRSCFMNVLLFFPAGLLCAGMLPGRWRRGGRMAWVVLAFSLLSLGIELAQFRLGIGQGEIDDVLHNALGVLAGFTCCRMAEVRSKA